MTRNPLPARGRSPTETRFRKGQSGNSAGRPKAKPKDRPSTFDIIMDRTLTIMQGGKAREVSVDEALQHKTYQQAIAGSRMARREVLKMIAKRENALAAKQPQVQPITRLIEPKDPTNAFDALCVLGIAAPDVSWSDQAGGGRLLLEPWAVQIALNRRGLKRLTQQDVAEIERCTRNVDALVWPERIKP